MRNKKQIAKEYILYTILLISSSYLIVSAIMPERMDSDLIVPSIASLKNPSLFYWGQDRLLSLTTFLLIPFRSISLNLYLNIFIQALFFSGLILFLVRSCCNERTVAILSYVATIFLILIIIPGGELYTFSKHAQPYSSSTLIVLGAFSIHKCNTKPKRFALSACLIVISLLLNPLSLILALTLPISFHIINKKDEDHNNINMNHLDWLLSVAGGVVFSAVCRKIYATSNIISSTSSIMSTDNLIDAIPIIYENYNKSFSNNFSLGMTYLMILLCLSCAITLLRSLTRTDVQQKQGSGMHSAFRFTGKDWKIYCLAITFNLFTLIPMASSQWVKMNQYSLRYFFPLYLCIFFGIILFSCTVNSLIIRYLNPECYKRIYYFCCGMGLAVLLGYSKPLAPNILQYSEMSRVEPLYEYIASNLSKNLYLGGNYWLCWPIKVWSIANNLELGVLTDRSSFDPISMQMSKRIEDKIKLHEDFSYYCISENSLVTNDCFWGVLHQIATQNKETNNWKMEKVIVAETEIHGKAYLHRINFSHS